MSTREPAATGTPQWARVPRWVFEHPDGSDLDVRIYAALAWMASPGRTVRIAATDLAAYHLGPARHPATVRRSLTRLERIGAVSMKRGRGRVPIITVHASPLDLAERKLPQGRFAFPT